MSTTPTDFLTGLESPDTFRPHLVRGSAEEHDAASPAGELSVWIPALLSFFDLKNQPFSEAEQVEVLTRNFVHEARVVQQVLQRCLLLGLSATPGADPGFPESGGKRVDATALALGGDYAGRRGTLSLAELLRVLADLDTLCDALIESREVNLSAWDSFGDVIARELSHFSAASGPRAHRKVLARSQPELLKLSERILPESLAGDMTAAFSLLTLTLEHLRLVESLLLRDYPLKHALPIFTLVHQQARELIELIETRALRAGEGQKNVYESLDSAAYALGMELQKVFKSELAGLAASRQAPTIYTKVENAFGLLRNCLQQTTIALARVFEPDFDGAPLFASVQSKLEQSLRLREDLWVLLQLVRRAERERDRRPLAPLIERLSAFQNGSMRLLMFKDWESYERFVAEVTAARGAIELGPVLHRFATYLEALFSQINMRATLAEHPFKFPPVVE